MRKAIFFILFFGLTAFIASGQERSLSPAEFYCNAALSVQLWPSTYSNIGFQVVAGAVIQRRFSLGAGLGVGSRNFDYIHIPFEVGYEFWKGNGAVHLYGGPTYGYYSGTKGFLGGTEFRFKPRLDGRNLRLFLALGLAFDRGAGGFYFDPNPEQVFTVAGPRFRIGMGL